MKIFHPFTATNSSRIRFYAWHRSSSMVDSLRVLFPKTNHITHSHWVIPQNVVNLVTLKLIILRPTSLTQLQKQEEKYLRLCKLLNVISRDRIPSTIYGQSSSFKYISISTNNHNCTCHILDWIPFVEVEQTSCGKIV